MRRHFQMQISHCVNRQLYCKMNIGIPKQPLPEVGDMLIAEPFMRDDNLRRTVVYLCEINEDGAYGMVLNQPLPVPMKQMIESFPIDGFFAR